jgi:acyl-CoA thioester hydrolase
VHRRHAAQRNFQRDHRPDVARKPGFNVKQFVTRIRARYCETDAAGVVYYGSFMHYFEVGKMEVFRELGLPYDREIPIVETKCRYPAPCHFDELLEIRTWFDDISTRKFRVRSEVYRVEDDGRFVLVGEGYTVHVSVDGNRTAAPLPEQFTSAFAALEEG